MKAHGYAAAAPGDPYFSHPLEGRGDPADMKLDAASICTALLHDTVGDTEATIEEIGRLFGPRSSGLVDRVTNSPRSSSRPRRRNRPRTPQLVLAMSEDIGCCW